MNALTILKIIGFGPVLAGYIYLTEPAHAKAIAPLETYVYQDPAGRPCKFVIGGEVYCHDGKAWHLRQPVRPQVRTAPVKPKPIADRADQLVLAAAIATARDFDRVPAAIRFEDTFRPFELAVK